jgi:hypothetical protein
MAVHNRTPTRYRIPSRAFWKKKESGTINIKYEPAVAGKVKVKLSL